MQSFRSSSPCRVVDDITSSWPGSVTILTIITNQGSLLELRSLESLLDLHYVDTCYFSWQVKPSDFKTKEKNFILKVAGKIKNW